MKLGKLAVHFNVLTILVAAVTAIIGFINGNQELLSHFLSPAQVSLVLAGISGLTLILHSVSPQGQAVEVTDTSTGKDVEIKTGSGDSSESK